VKTCKISENFIANPGWSLWRGWPAEGHCPWCPGGAGCFQCHRAAGPDCSCRTEIRNNNKKEGIIPFARQCCGSRCGRIRIIFPDPDPDLHQEPADSDPTCLT
jgi:hypothetical protein